MTCVDVWIVVDDEVEKVYEVDPLTQEGVQDVRWSQGLEGLKVYLVDFGCK